MATLRERGSDSGNHRRHNYVSDLVWLLRGVKKKKKKVADVCENFQIICDFPDMPTPVTMPEMWNCCVVATLGIMFLFESYCCVRPLGSLTVIVVERHFSSLGMFILNFDFHPRNLPGETLCQKIFLLSLVNEIVLVQLQAVLTACNEKENGVWLTFVPQHIL